MPLRRPLATRVVLIVGTRPEAIKLAPLALALRGREDLACAIWCTGQHAKWAPEMLAFFGLFADRIFEIPDTGNGLAGLGGTLMLNLQAAIEADRPDVVVVQGDTSSAFAGALAAAYAGIPVVHVEAGLRSGDRNNPFPEEAHRRAISHFAALHCAPTERATNHLLSEGIGEDDILFCGNTVIDALHHVRQIVPANDVVPGITDPNRKLVLMTCHRRESWGAPFAAICAAVRRLARRGDCEIVVVLHPNPALAEIALPILDGQDAIHLVPPLGYPDFAQLLGRAALILTDSGGVQEEASALGTPLLVLRETTERPEAVQTGTARLIGCREDDIVAAATELLGDEGALSSMRVPCSLYGDGHAAQRIADAIALRWSKSRTAPIGTQINAAAALMA